MKFEKKDGALTQRRGGALLEVAEALGSGGDFELQGGGEKLQLNVADEVTFALRSSLRAKRPSWRWRSMVTSTPRGRRGNATFNGSARDRADQGTTGGRRRR